MSAILGRAGAVGQVIVDRRKSFCEGAKQHATQMICHWTSAQEARVLKRCWGVFSILALRVILLMQNCGVISAQKRSELICDSLQGVNVQGRVGIIGQNDHRMQRRQGAAECVLARAVDGGDCEDVSTNGLEKRQQCTRRGNVGGRRWISAIRATDRG